MPRSLPCRIPMGCHIAVCLLVIQLTPLSAWNDHASLTGTVSDPTQKAIPGATVTVKALDTGISHIVTANASGFYGIASLPVGNYTVTFDSTGFEL